MPYDLAAHKVLEKLESLYRALDIEGYRALVDLLTARDDPKYQRRFEMLKSWHSGEVRAARNLDFFRLLAAAKVKVDGVSCRVFNTTVTAIQLVESSPAEFVKCFAPPFQARYTASTRPAQEDEPPQSRPRQLPETFGLDPSATGRKRWHLRSAPSRTPSAFPDSSVRKSRLILRAIQADITQLEVDAIVNPTNRWLLGRGDLSNTSVDGAIHRAAGRELDAFFMHEGGCDPGDAKISPGFGLPARYVIHTVGPVWYGGRRGEADQLTSCYRRSLEVAVQHDIECIAFPAISTGINGYPPLPAAEIAIATVRGFDPGSAPLREVIFCCYSRTDLDIYLGSAPDLRWR